MEGKKHNSILRTKLNGLNSTTYSLSLLKSFELTLSLDTEQELVNEPITCHCPVQELRQASVEPRGCESVQPAH